jgi:hypothetical protein
MKARSPDRLYESSSSEVERLLLRAGRERAPQGAKRRAIAAATGVVAASALTAGTAGGAVASGAVAGKTGAGIATLLSLKWVVVVGVASVSVAAGTAAVHVVRSERAATRAAEIAAADKAHAIAARAPVARSASVAPLVPVPVASAAAASVVSVPPPSAPVVAEVVAPRPSAPPGTTSNKVTGVPSSNASSNPAAELVMLDQARGAIRSGAPAEALSILDAYRARFARGVMAPEASILRVEALVGAGDRAGAEREAESFRRANPNSPYAARIDSLLAGSAGVTPIP